jgi:hypothetical protein
VWNSVPAWSRPVPLRRATTRLPIPVVAPAGGVFIAGGDQYNVRHVRADGRVFRAAGLHNSVARLPTDGRTWSRSMRTSSLEYLPNGALLMAADGGVDMVWPQNGSSTPLVRNTTFSIHVFAYRASDDTLFLGDTSSRTVVLRTSIAPSGPYTTVAGGPRADFPVSGPPRGTDFSFGSIAAVMVDPATGILYVSDRWRHRVIRVLSNGTAGIFAGRTDTLGTSGDGGPATAALLTGANALAAMGSGAVAIAVSEGIRVVSAAGIITTLTATPSPPNSLSWDASTATLWVGFSTGVLRVVNGALCATPLGRPAAPVRGVNVPGGATWVTRPRHLALLPGDRLLILCPCRGLFLNLATQTLQPAIGSGADGSSALPNCSTTGDGIPAVLARMVGSRGLAAEPDGSWAFLDAEAHGGIAPVLRRVNATGFINTVRTVGLYYVSLAIDGAGGYWTTDVVAKRVVRIRADGTIVAMGTGNNQVAGFTGSATSASFAQFGGVAFDPVTGDVLVADSQPWFPSAGAIRRINGVSYAISLVAGGNYTQNDTCCPAPAEPLSQAAMSQLQTLALAQDGSGRICFFQYDREVSAPWRAEGAGERGGGAVACGWAHVTARLCA